MWIFDYFEELESYDFGEVGLQDDIVETIYWWEVLNNGNKLIKVRFYPDL